jgi:hypothetical protein
MNDAGTIELPPGLDMAAGKAGIAETDQVEERDATVARSSSQILYRDPADVRTILSMAWTGTLLVLLLLASVAFNIWQYWRRPDRIVVDRSSGRVLMINDREYGETEAVKLGPDKLTNADKQYLAGEFVKAIYGVDPATRPRDIERALRMMAPASAFYSPATSNRRAYSISSGPNHGKRSGRCRTFQLMGAIPTRCVSSASRRSRR